ncbi:P-loop containing nucleoside triphosphate hydrolase protein [Daldinia caldariorum]|uniref:P-loop containing nucleoside triphosphate hydrolase protein n=1 Tax=Daldinia caldariorum TaxID=326644 RepID=UPI0020073A28|nr:P-loop containing nucleoside triphosphate hydrolase protein [Daldinia caldariorum]KAI1467619.1 P-loop containing nucleoside triphosphate hydrolase protein [Daldinia caldariorum]
MTTKPTKRDAAFLNLSVHGFIASHGFQHTVYSYLASLPRYIVDQLRRNRGNRVEILDRFDGLVHHGEMLLVLGRPGSGCTTLLKAIAGDTHGIYVDPKSQINYQGIPYAEMHTNFKGESVYLAELDEHLAELTVGNTLTFAASTREPVWGKPVQSPKTSADTCPLGPRGRRRREKTYEHCRGPRGWCSATMLDNSTRGLDSSTALEFVGLLRRLADESHSTVLMTMYQASENMYQKFDKVTVLYEGRQIYFGPIELAGQYFQDLGFERPAHATMPDFLTSLTNPAERIIRHGFEGQAPRSPDDFVKAWKKSSLSNQLILEIDSFNATYPTIGENGKKSKAGWRSKLAHRTSTYVIPLHLQVLRCLQRAFQRVKNQPGTVIGNIVASAILAIVIGSAFFNLPQDSSSVDRRAVLIFFSLLYTALSPSFEILLMWKQRPIVEKHNRYALYHPVCDSVASMISDLPNKFLSAVVFQTVLYFFTDLRRTAAAFFTWFLFAIVLLLNMSMWFRLVGSISRTLEQSTVPTTILILLASIYVGFVVPVPYEVGWLKWFRFVDPIAYAYESLMINEFNYRRFPCSQLVPSGPSYPDVRLQDQICTTVGSVTGQDYVEGNIYLLEKYGYVPSHKWRYTTAPPAPMIFGVCGLHLLCAQYVPAESSKGDIVRFRRPESKRTKTRRQDSEENGSPRFAQYVGEQHVSKEKSDTIQEVATPGILEQSSVFHWNNLSYEVKVGKGKTKTILDNIQGWVVPGTLTALMGVTGAGKTTLLDVLANRANFGVARGEICIDGQERDESFQRKIGYAQQEDIHLPTATVREALEFSALMRQLAASREDKLSYVDNVIEILEMKSYAEAIVGVPGDGLNIEQRKRLTIGIELVAKPELLLFFDEPTSGFDSQTAWSICTLLRKLSANGQAVLCTIHQPSSQLFMLFDRLLLLNNKGQCVYFGDIGEDASTVVSYFEGRGALPPVPGANPAEWVLQITSGETTNASSDIPPSEFWAREWAASKQQSDVAGRLVELKAKGTPENTSSTSGYKAYATPWLFQMVSVTRRIFQEYWRRPVYIYSKFSLCIGIALFDGLSFQNTRLDLQGFSNLLFSMFLLTQIFGTMDQQVIPRLMEGRALFEGRERRSKTYHWTVFLASNVVVEFTWQLLATAFIFAIWYYPTGLQRTGEGGVAFGVASRGALSFVIILFFCLWTITFSQALASVIELEESAVQVATLLFYFSLVFCGVLVFPKDLPDFWIFVWRASPLTYSVDGLSLAGLWNVDLSCSRAQMLSIPAPGGGATCGEYLKAFADQNFGAVINPMATTGSCEYCPLANTKPFFRETLQVSGEHPWYYAGYLSVFIVLNILAMFGLYWFAGVRGRNGGLS